MWRGQQQGTPLGELAILANKDVIPGGLDGESWRLIRDRLMSHRLITQTMQGKYLLSKDLHTVSFIDLKQIINEELRVPPIHPYAQDWQIQATRLLEQQRNQQRSLLDIDLAGLFSGKQRIDESEGNQFRT